MVSPDVKECAFPEYNQLLGLRQFLTNESPLKTMKNAFYFMLKAPVVLEIFIFLSGLFGYAEKQRDKKVMTNFKIYKVTDWAISAVLKQKD